MIADRDDECISLSDLVLFINPLFSHDETTFIQRMKLLTLALLRHRRSNPAFLSDSNFTLSVCIRARDPKARFGF